MATDTYRLFPLHAADAQLILAVLSNASERVHAVPDLSEELRLSGATLGRLTAMFDALLGPEAQQLPFGDVINLNGERLYDMRLTLEEWDLICAHLSKFSTELVLTAEDGTLEGEERIERANSALTLMNRISEGIRDR
jgi:hypothetical protein